MYQVRAYPSRAAGESGCVTGADRSNTGSYATAAHVARGLAQAHGAAVVENKDTGNRTWFCAERAAQPADSSAPTL